MDTTARERPFAQRRRDLGWDLGWAAIRLGVSPDHLRALELSRRPVPLPLAERMAREYEASLTQLFSPADSTRAGSAARPRSGSRNLLRGRRAPGGQKR